MVTIDFLILSAIYILVLFRKWRAKGRDILLVNTLMYIYLAFVLYFTLMPIAGSLFHILEHPYTPMHMIPFEDLIRGRGDYIRQIVLNVIMMTPFGFLAPLRMKKGGRFLKTVLYTFLFSLCIELLQPLISGLRASDITDLITNTLGGLIGYLLYLLLRPLTERILLLLRAEAHNG